MNHHKRDWEDLAKLDPYWAILSHPKRKFGGWDVEEFFHTGNVDFESVMRVAEDLGHPRKRGRALDFGCGLGRITRAMTRHFDECLGIDISQTMLARARELNSQYLSCKFLASHSEDLGNLPDDHLDLIYCDLVLQHLPTRVLIQSIISEFVRTLRPNGLAVFQLLSFIPRKYRLQPARRIYELLRAVGIAPDTLYKRFGLTPIRNNCLSEQQVLTQLQRLGGRLLKIQRRTIPETLVRSSTYFFTK